MRPALLLPFALVALSSSPALADPKTECLEAASRGQTLRDAHKLLEAREAFRVCSRQECPAIVQSDCGGWLEGTVRALPTIVFDAKDASGADLSAVRVSLDGRVLAERLDGSALPVNPGDHDFTFEAAGQERVTRHFVIKEGEKQRRERVAFQPAKAGAQPSATPSPALAPENPSPATSSSEGLGKRKVLALFVGGAGVVVGGIGAFLNLDGKSRWQDATSHCTNGLCPPSDADTARGAATQGTVGMVMLGAGVLAVAGGVVLWLTAPHPDASTGGLPPSAGVALTPNGVLLRGSF